MHAERTHISHYIQISVGLTCTRRVDGDCEIEGGDGDVDEQTAGNVTFCTHRDSFCPSSLRRAAKKSRCERSRRAGTTALPGELQWTSRSKWSCYVFGAVEKSTRSLFHETAETSCTVECFEPIWSVDAVSADNPSKTGNEFGAETDLG
jgi:hypothetical protein